MNVKTNYLSKPGELYRESTKRVTDTFSISSMCNMYAVWK